MDNKQAQWCINEISRFLAVRDIRKLECNELEKAFGIKKVDVLVLLGNSIPYTINCAAEAYRNNLCDKILINGGIGHSTSILREYIKKDKRLSFIEVKNRTEADMFFDIITRVYDTPSDAIIIENQSTNCGDNALKAITLLNELDISYESLMLIQDPTMQLRTYASFSKYINNKKVELINYAPFIPVVDSNLKLTNKDINGIWSEQRYLELIMGEIPRLRDDINGYGPAGRNFIVHVNIPREIEECYKNLKVLIGDKNLYAR
ncbi:YdcF family protein [Clostridium sp.]|uniref:YdcF family protein n=1 Tax=Clostridium sp. TaxID=1506 RepID=UPI002841B48C|nr:YdcF family protein [Clostridium sp.]MDR3598412.1 YdcF family protein [Clostridium sp.]